MCTCVLVDEPWQIESFIRLNYAIVRTFYGIVNEMTVDHVVFNRKRYMIRCEQQNWLFLFYFTWPRKHHMAMYLSINAMSMKRESSLPRRKLKVINRMNIVIIVYMSVSWKKTGLEQWSMTCEDVYTLKLNVYDHMYILSNVSFSFSSSFFASFFFLLDSQLIMMNDSKRCWSIKKVVRYTDNIIRKNRII
jgi:hypothetical protein